MMIVLRPGALARSLCLSLVIAGTLTAEPQLTTIRDVLYKADGSRFNGTAVISWTSFEATDKSNIAPQNLIVRIVDGNLLVKLVPNIAATPASYYSVKYNSDGRIQFEERWAVPATWATLRVRDVRIGTPSAVASASAPLQESDIVGLVADLEIRPVKGPGFAPGRTAYISPEGALESVSGTLSDCVRVDGTSGPCGAGSAMPGFVDLETPGGLVDGANAYFALAAVPDPPESLALYRNGMMQKRQQDYVLSGNSIQFLAGAIPQPGDTLLASYRLAGGATPVSAVTSPQVLCAGAGGSTSSTSATRLGSCSIAPGMLQPGDRIEIRFDFAHVGTSAGFTFDVRWGSTVLMQRTAGGTETMVTGRADAALYSAGAQLSGMSWGTNLTALNAVANASDSVSSGILIDFRGNLSQSGSDALALRNYTVIRYP